MNEYISESETKAMFERLSDWFNAECGRKAVVLTTGDFDGDDFIGLEIPTVCRRSDSFVWTTNPYRDFLFGYDYPGDGQISYYVKSVFETVETYLEYNAYYAGGRISRPVESALRKLLSLKGVSSLAELELRLAAMGENRGRRET